MEMLYTMVEEALYNTFDGDKEACAVWCDDMGYDIPDFLCD